MSVLRGLEPESVWLYFEEISRIPRLSKHEEKIRQYIIDFALQHKLQVKEDAAGNILIVKPASKGLENRKTVVLQSHLDMVGEKNSDHPHNWEKDPIIPVIGNEWVTASGTTLGADDGIGIAAQLAILSDNQLKTGKIECLFTVDEETGMTGAINLKPDFFDGRILLNLDSEDEGILFIGCAGGIDTVGTLTYSVNPVPDYSLAFDLSLTGLHGGHSGDEIHNGYANSLKVMTKLLSDLSIKFDSSLALFNGGNLRNAIPRESFATITVNINNKEAIVNFLSEASSLLKKELGASDPELKLTFKEVPLPKVIMNKEFHKNLLSTLGSIPHGVIAWSRDMPDLVETSTNLASLKIEENNKITIVSTQRSSVKSAKHAIASEVEKCLNILGASVTHSDGYPGWEPNLSSEILQITVNSYEKLFSKTPLVKAIHAGLECGLIFEKFPGIDMISFGPTIKGAHTPEERLNIETTKMFWDLLLDVINSIPEN